MLQDSLAPNLKNQMLVKLRQFETFVTGKSWLVGGQLTVADFGMYELLRVLRAWQPDMFTTGMVTIKS